MPCAVIAEPEPILCRASFVVKRSTRIKLRLIEDAARQGSPSTNRNGSKGPPKFPVFSGGRAANSNRQIEPGSEFRLGPSSHVMSPCSLSMTGDIIVSLMCLSDSKGHSYCLPSVSDKIAVCTEN